MIGVKIIMKVVKDMNEEKQKMKKNKILIIIMFTFGMIGISLLSYDYILSKIRLTFETVNLELYGNNEPEKVDKNTEKEQEIIEEKQEEPQESQNNTQPTPTEASQKNSYYFGYLQIPKINLNQGLVPVNSRENNVNKNIQTIYPSDMPNVENGNLILAAHSGTSRISYFKHLWKLATNDQFYILYNNAKYIYNIVDIYTVPKNGQVEIRRNLNKSVVTLITCTKNDDTTQTVYIGELIGKEGV